MSKRRVPVLTRPATAVAGLLAAGVCLLSGCGGGTDAYVGDDGEQVALGESIDVEVDEEFSGDLQVSLDSIEKGDVADTESLSDLNSRGRTPFYLQFTLTNAGGDDFAGAVFGGADMGLVNGLDAEGTAVGPQVGTTDFEPCPGDELPAEFDEAGATAQACVLVLTDGEEIVGANYIPGDIDTTSVWFP